MNIILVILIVITAIFALLTAYMFGVLTERMAWNKLIEDGIIPAPRKR